MADHQVKIPLTVEVKLLLLAWYDRFVRWQREVRGTIVAPCTIVLHGRITSDFTVLLDGKPVPGMPYMANEREGWVKSYRRGPDGELLMGGGRLMSQTLRGEVTFAPVIREVEPPPGSISVNIKADVSQAVEAVDRAKERHQGRCRCGKPSGPGGRYPDGLCTECADKWCESNPQRHDDLRNWSYPPTAN